MLTNDTLAANAVRGGIGISDDGDAAGSVYNEAFGRDILTGNAVNASLTLNNTILANTSGGNDLSSQASTPNDAAIVTGSNNLVMTHSGATDANVITQTADPNLGPLQNNGGPTWTMALTTGSSAIAAGDPRLAGLPDTDQRGFARQINGQVDLGAFELQAGAVSVFVPPFNAFSSGSQQLLFDASVVVPGVSSVNEGTVTFTVQQGSTVIGTPVTSDTVSSGNASVSYVLPADTPAGAYSVTATYNDGSSNPGNFRDSRASSTLTIGQAKVNTTAAAATASYSVSSQSVTLNASLTNIRTPGDVNGGTVTFTILQGSTVIGTPVTSGTVSNGSASASFLLPAGTAIGTYTLVAHYFDADGNYTNFSGDSDATLTLRGTAVATTAGNISTPFSQGTQTVTLAAAVSPAITGGAVTFTVLDGAGHPVGSAVQGNVSDGSASASFTVPSGLAVGAYTIQVSYSDPSDPYADGGDTSGTLTISTAPVATTAGNVSTPFSTGMQTVTLTAAVSSAATEGTVTFTVYQQVVQNGYQVAASVQGNVSNGSATASFAVPPGLAVGPYIIAVSYSDAGGPFVDGGDTSGTLTINSAPVTIVAGSVVAPFHQSTQTVMLTSTVSPAVSGGVMTFTVYDIGAHQVGNAVQGAVSNGSASASFTVPQGLAVGSYYIVPSYDSGGSYYPGSTNAGVLTIRAVPITIAAGNVATSFSQGAQTVTLTATTSLAISGGVATFTVLDGNGTPVGAAVQGNVSGARAAASFTVPTGLAVGAYTIAVSYSNASGSYVDNGDFYGTLTISTAPVTTTAGNVGANFSGRGQPVTLTAAVSPAISGGIATFTVLDNNGHQVGTAVQGNVSNGSASASFTVPSGLAVGAYTIKVSYSDAGGPFVDGGDTSGTLTIRTAPVTTAAGNVGTPFSTGTQTVTLTAAVSPAISGGIVTFTVLDGSGTPVGIAVQGNVSNGSASASFTVPSGLAVGAYTIKVSYSDAGGPFVDGGDTSGTLTIRGTPVTITALDIKTAFHKKSEVVTLTASVSGPSPITGGIVTFTVFDSTGHQVGAAVQGSVSKGSASARFTVPAGLPPGVYTIKVSYSDIGGPFVDGGDNSGTLTIGG